MKLISPDHNPGRARELSRRRLLSGAAAASVAHPAMAQSPGQAWIVMGFPPGGAGDLVSRPLAERLRGTYAPAVLPDYRTGAGGRIAAEYVRRAAPDGSVILQVPSSVMTLYPHIYRDLRYDPLSDFVPVTAVCTYAYSLTAGPGLPDSVCNVADLLAWARANPTRASYGVPASGSPLHFAGMILSRTAGVELTAVPYRGGAPLLQDLLGGQVPVSFNVLSEILPHVRAGRLRSLGTCTAERSPFLPEVPTLVEAGYPDLAMEEWLGWFVPAGTPDATMRRLHAAVRDGLHAPDFQEAALTRNGLGAIDLTQQDFAARVRRDHGRWAPLVRATGFTAEG